MHKNKLLISIISTLLLLLGFQIAVVLLVNAWHDIGLSLWNHWYILVAIALHVNIAMLLCLLSKEFYTIPEGKQLTRINFINVISLFRMSSTPTLVLFVTSSHAIRLTTITIVWSAMVFLSDFIDGKLARRFNQRTRIGQYIDSFSDYLILLVISILLYNYLFIPGWFFISAMVRILLPILGLLISCIIKCNISHHTSWFGRASIFAIMTTLLFSLMHMVFEYSHLHQQIMTILGLVVVIGFIAPALIVWCVHLTRQIQNRKNEA